MPMSVYLVHRVVTTWGWVGMLCADGRVWVWDGDGLGLGPKWQVVWWCGMAWHGVAWSHPCAVRLCCAHVAIEPSDLAVLHANLQTKIAPQLMASSSPFNLWDRCEALPEQIHNVTCVGFVKISNNIVIRMHFKIQQNYDEQPFATNKCNISPEASLKTMLCDISTLQVFVLWTCQLPNLSPR
jgi:hypothetical protein